MRFCSTSSGKWPLFRFTSWPAFGADERRVAVTFKFFLYTIIGSLFMLAGFVYLYYQTGPAANGLAAHSSDLQAFYNLSLTAAEQSWLFWLIFVAFAVKMPIFPFHTWQPDTYTEAPAPATMLLSGIMLKMGIYGTMRWLLPVMPLGVSQWGWLVMILAVIGIIYGAIIAIRQRDMKRLIAYSSLSHVGLMAAGVFSLTQMGLQGAVVQMLAHGVNVVGMFFIADIIQRRTGTRLHSRARRPDPTTPLLSVSFLVMLLSTGGPAAHERLRGRISAAGGRVPVQQLAGRRSRPHHHSLGRVLAAHVPARDAGPGYLVHGRLPRPDRRASWPYSCP